MDERKAWDEQYQQKGNLWRGSAALHFKVSPGEKILELGCGNGKTSLALFSAGAIVYCLDFSREALLRSSESQDPNIMHILGDVIELPFPEGYFDLVNCSHIFEHLPTEKRRIAALEAIRVLRSGGRLEFQGFSISDMRYGTGQKLEENTFRRGDGIMYHYFTDDEVKDLFPGMQVNFLEHRTQDKRYHAENKVRDVIQAEFLKP
jgi:ubiquinone/menaquinone biosynthesis C-methylase UbiE